MVGRGHLDHVKVVAHHVLPGKPFAPAVLVDDVAAMADVSGLDDGYAVLLVDPHRVFQLRLVVRNRAGGLVVADEFHADPPPVGNDRVHVEVRIGPGEAELVAVLGPVPFPSQVPALRQHASVCV